MAENISSQIKEEHILETNYIFLLCLIEKLKN